VVRAAADLLGGCVCRAFSSKSAVRASYPVNHRKDMISKVWPREVEDTHLLSPSGRAGYLP
jgi:hypothetical protein